MSLYLVRHAKAGPRTLGPDDRLRSLSRDGNEQARALVTHLIDVPVARLVSSPFVRCRQTLGPLAEATGLPIEDLPSLIEAMPFEPVLSLLSELPDHSVLCSHGDLIPDVIQALARRGMHVHGEQHWSKGAVWVLDRTGTAITAGRSFRL
jgi:phosphohistidine phosphatase SixA